VLIRIEGEHETVNGWLYTFAVDWTDAKPTDHELTISWVDHEHLVGGSVTPSMLARVSAEIAAGYFGAGAMPERFDVSSLRRVIPGFDSMVRDQC
jgi:hypothetical protein